MVAYASVSLSSTDLGDSSVSDSTVPVTTIDCPYCAEPINAKSKKCRHCSEILDPQMREIEMLKNQRNAPHVFMNAGGGAASASSASAASSGGENPLLRRFPHWMHIR